MVATTPQRLAREEATILQVEVIAKTTAPPPYALTEATVAGREALLALPLVAVAVAVAVTTLPALDHPLAVALDRPPLLHREAVVHPVAPPLLAAVLEDADSKHF